MTTPKREDTARDTVSRVADDAKAEGKRLFLDAKSVAVDIAEERKEAAGGYVKALARATESGSNSLDEQGHERSASLLADAARNLRSAADSIEKNGIEDLWSELESVARNRPAIFYGSAFVLGFGLVRVLKSSAVSREADRASTAGSPSKRKS